MPVLASNGMDATMLIHDPPKKQSTKELKVNIPVKYHLQLHSLKVLKGRQIHGVVTEALDLYFARMAEAQQRAGGSR